MQANKNSLHYRYYCWIRRMCGIVDEPSTTSLCPYFQTMLWGSIFCVVTSPALVIGWISMKLGRLACKLQNPITDGVVELLKSKTDWITRLDEGPSDFSESPILTGLAFSFLGITVIVYVAGAVLATASVLGLFGYGLWNMTWIFAHMFMIFYLFGFCFHSLYSGTVWLFTNGPLWYSVGMWIVWGLAWILGIGVICLVLCVFCIGLSKLSFAHRFGKFLTNKFNGFNEAQKTRARRVEAIKKLPAWGCEYCKYNNNPADRISCCECGVERSSKLFRWLKRVSDWVIRRRSPLPDRKVTNRKIDIAGPLRLVWSFIVAFKRGVCPTVEFVDPVQLQADAQASAQERMNNEKESEEAPQGGPDEQSNEPT